MIFTEEDLNCLNAIAGLLASFGCDSQAGCVLYIQHKIVKAMETDERKCRNEKHVEENLEAPGLESPDRDAEVGYSAEAC
jgi:hypothetical protein